MQINVIHVYMNIKIQNNFTIRLPLAHFDTNVNKQMISNQNFWIYYKEKSDHSQYY